MRTILRTGLTAVVLLGGGCRSDGGAAPDEGTGTGKVEVVATAYPLFEAASAVGGDRAEVTNLVAAGSEPHDLELSPGQAELLEDADLALTVGRGFQPAIEKAAKRRKGETVQVLPDLDDGDDGTSEAHDDGDGHGHGPGEDGASELARDPHVWLDPKEMVRVVEKVRDALIEIDRAGETQYQANAESFITDLESLGARFEAGLESCDRRVIVASHAAFGHLTNAYELEQHAVSGLSPDAEPTADRLDELATLVRKEGVTTVFTEELVSPKVAEALAREVGVKTAVLSPLEGLTSEEAEAGEGYVSLMDRNLAVLREALGCR